MKKILFLVAILAPILVLSQGDWTNPKHSRKGGKGGNLNSIGLWLNGGITNIYRNTDEYPALGEGNFEGGISFRIRGNTSFVVKAGVYTQSDFFPPSTTSQGQTWGSGYQYGWGYDYSCGCYPQQQSVSNRFEYLRIGHFQVGLSNQGKSHGVRGTVGIGGFDYQIPTIDSLTGAEVPLQIARGTVFALGFDAKVRLGDNLLSGRIQSFTDVKRISMAGTIGKVELDYLFGFGENYFEGKLYAGLGVSAKKHVVSGDEYTVRVILEGGHDEIPFWIRGYFGVAYNPLPAEGIGWELGFQIWIDRFAKAIYR